MEQKTFAIRIDDLTIDCADAQKLSAFYADLLGWQAVKLAESLFEVRAAGFPMRFLIEQESDYVPPVWPEAPGEQQKQMHLDFTVSDLSAAVARAKALGAVETAAQFNPKQWITMLDPAGHPFCLCLPEQN